MTVTMPARDLDRLEGSGLSPADLENVDVDVEGRLVTDRLGEEVGTVDDLLVSRQLLRAPFLILQWGGLLGIGRQQRLVPLDVVTVHEDRVTVDRDRDVIRSGPAYAGDLEGEEAETHYLEVYEHYGVDPYWRTAPVSA